MEYEELSTYDTIYFCGGNTQYLLKRINDTGFNSSIKCFVENGGVYVGVSAGSIVTANNFSENLGYLDCKLEVHGTSGINIGKFDPENYSDIKLPDNRAIIIKDDNYEVIE
jgi:peptidase E